LLGCPFLIVFCVVLCFCVLFVFVLCLVCLMLSVSLGCPQRKTKHKNTIQHRKQCIKDFNAETNTSLQLNLLSFFICGCQHHQRKTICLYVYISDIRQIVGYRTRVFIQRFPWRLHITITYNLPHLRLWYAVNSDHVPSFFLSWCLNKSAGDFRCLRYYCDNVSIS
jgi:hypothetical protein